MDSSTIEEITMKRKKNTVAETGLAIGSVQRVTPPDALFVLIIGTS